MSQLIRCALGHFWGILITVLVGSYSLIAALMVTGNFTLDMFWIITLIATAFLTGTLLLTLLFTKMNILGCRT